MAGRGGGMMVRSGPAWAGRPGRCGGRACAESAAVGAAAPRAAGPDGSRGGGDDAGSRRKVCGARGGERGRARPGARRAPGFQPWDALEPEARMDAGASRGLRWAWAVGGARVGLARLGRTRSDSDASAPVRGAPPAPPDQAAAGEFPTRLPPPRARRRRARGTCRRKSAGAPARAWARPKNPSAGVPRRERPPAGPDLWGGGAVSAA